MLTIALFAILQQSPVLVVDAEETLIRGPRPREFTTVGSRTYFSAESIPEGRELWVSDGTPEGTVLRADLDLIGSSSPRELTACGALLFFIADSPQPSLSWSLFVDDGTSVRELTLGTLEDPQPTNLYSDGNQLWFSAAGHLWRSDGTQGGTTQITDGGGFFSTRPARPVGMLDDELVFVIRYAPKTRGLFATDGTTAGTRKLSDLGLGLNDYGFETGDSVVVDGVLYFPLFDGALGNEPWRTDGTPAGTHILADLDPLSSNPSDFARAGNSVFFLATFQPIFPEVAMLSDGTPGGTSQIALHSTGGPFPPLNIATRDVLGRANGSVAFMTWWGEIWITKGLGAEPLPFSLPPGPAQSGHSRMVELGTDIAYLGFGPSGSGLHLTDGSAGKTRRLLEFDVGITGQEIELYASNGRIWFTGQHLDWQPWTSDGTVAGTHALPIPSSTVTGGSSPTRMFSFRDRSYVTTTAGDFVTDGTKQGTERLRWPLELRPGVELNGRMILPTQETAPVSSTGVELWSTDGTDSGVELLADISPGQSPSHPHNLTVVGDLVFFTADRPGTGYELWVTDGTPAGTQLIADIEPGAVGSEPGNFVPFRGGVLFDAGADYTARELYWSDGTPTGTRMVVDLNGTDATDLKNITSDGTIAVFTAFVPSGGRELHVTDGTSAGTFPLGDFFPAPPFDFVQDIELFDGAFYFGKRDANLPEYELWRTDGTAAGTELVTELGGASFIQDLVPTGSLLFAHTLASGASELWATDGTAAGTELLVHLDEIWELTPIGSGSDVVFRGFDGVEYRLWSSNGTPGGTQPITPNPSTASGMWREGTRLLFADDDPLLGEELHAIDLLPIGVWALEPFGSGWAPAGLPVPSLSGVGRAAPGETVTLVAEGGAHGDIARFAMSMDVALGSLPLPGSFGLASPITWLGGPRFVDDGTSRFSDTLPADPALVGQRFFAQAFVAGTGPGAPDALSRTNPLEILVGP